MEQDCQKYTEMDINNLISKTGQVSFYLTSIIISSYLVSAFFYLTGAVAFQGSNDSVSRELLFKMDLPFETNESPNYEFVVTIQFLIHFSAALTFGSFTALLLMVVLHVGCQIDIMCQNLTDVLPKNENKLKHFISRYQEIIIFTEKIEKLFTYIALSQLVSNTINTCCEGFLIVISQLIGDTAYDILWYDLHPNESQLLIPVILKSQKGFILTFGKFSSLSLESFTSIMKISASYMSVLLAVY